MAAAEIMVGSEDLRTIAKGTRQTARLLREANHHQRNLINKKRSEFGLNSAQEKE